MSLLTDLISYWKLDEASGTRVDSHGSNDLTDNNTVGSAAGKIGNAADFEADNSEYLSHVDNDDLSTGDIDFTFSIWFFAEGYNNFPMLIRKADSAGREYALFYNTGGVFGLTFGVFSAGGTQTDVNAGNLSTGQWYHIVCGHDSVNNELFLYIDNGTPFTASHSAGVRSTGTGDFQIGASTDQSLYWDGLIDEVGFWKRRLTTDEIAQLYNSGNGLSYDDFDPPAAPDIGRFVTVPDFDSAYREQIEADSRHLAPVLYLPVPPPPPPPPLTPAPTLNPVTPPADGGWQAMIEAHLGSLTQPTPAPLTNLPPTPLPQAGRTGKGLIPRDPLADVPTRRALDRISDCLNSLMSEGRLNLFDRDGRWTVGGGIIATRPPGVNDDITVGALPGMNWVNTASQKVWVCASNTAGAAVWVAVN